MNNSRRRVKRKYAVEIFEDNQEALANETKHLFTVKDAQEWVKALEVMQTL